MNRFFVDSIATGRCALPEAVSRQIATVLRMRPGEEIILLDNKGFQALVAIAAMEKKRVLVDVGEIKSAPDEPVLKITLYQSLPKADKMAGIIRRCVELGVSAVQPVETARSVARLSDGRLERWREIAREAAEQCGRGRVPIVEAPVGFSEALSGLPTESIALVCAPGGAPLSSLSIDSLKEYALFIGPEGGFEDGEIKALVAQGAQAVGLGPRILRCETAGPAALAVMMAQSGGWG